eukprot:9038442-Pyramimonas_sp.AAC.1
MGERVWRLMGCRLVLKTITMQPTTLRQGRFSHRPNPNLVFTDRVSDVYLSARSIPCTFAICFAWPIT